MSEVKINSIAVVHLNKHLKLYFEELLNLQKLRVENLNFIDNKNELCFSLIFNTYLSILIIRIELIASAEEASSIVVFCLF